MSRPRDLSFEALVEATGATVSAERGALNKALKEIREAESELEDEDLALLIKLRSTSYRKAWPDMALTPTALSKHWARIEVEKPRPTYLEPLGGPSRCSVCDGHKMVMARQRPSDNPQSLFEEWAPCPECNSSTTGSYWRADGTRHEMMSPDEVRKRIE